ncbi:hypothetical protein H311_01122, partial [Anncaliia algerae PRA109]
VQRSPRLFISHSNRRSFKVEVNNNTTRAYALIIPRKELNTISGLMSSQFASFGTIWSDKHCSCGQLSQLEFHHGTVCHKYEFVNRIAAINTHSIASFHNTIKELIKKGKDT